jgi:L-ascorbate metabolism protein UlaG (beta-lactamase superfamily)
MGDCLKSAFEVERLEESQCFIRLRRIKELSALIKKTHMSRPRFWEMLIMVALGCAAVFGEPPKPEAKSAQVTIEYIAHACFRITSPSGKQVLLDPYASRVWLGYDFPPDVRADAVLISHPHYDHDGGEAMHRKVPWADGTPVFHKPGTNQVGDIRVVGFAGKHADPWGKEFGQINTIWMVESGGLRVVHLGDNGPLTEAIVRQLGRVDVLMIPIDSQFHILKADEIATIRKQLSPRVLIPMHYRHDDLEPVEGKPEALGNIEDWAKRESNARYVDGNVRSFSLENLPEKPEVLIFKHSPLIKAPPR